MATTPPSILFLMEISDLAAEIFQFLWKDEITRFGGCCFRLSFTPFRFQFSEHYHHRIHAERFCAALTGYETSYDALAEAIQKASINPFDSKILQCAHSQTHSSAFSTASSSSSSRCELDRASLSPPPLLPRSHPHTKYALRSLRFSYVLYVLPSVHLPFLRSHLLNFNDIRKMRFDCKGRSDEIIVAEQLPCSLRLLDFGDVAELAGGPLPASITDLNLGRRFSSPITFPATLRRLTLPAFRIPLSAGSLPPTLEELLDLNQSPQINVLPSSLTTLRFADSYNEPLVVGALPPHLDTLICGEQFNQRLQAGVLPASLTRRVLDGPHYPCGEHNQPFEQQCLPASLRVLQLSSSFNQPLLPGHLPQGLTALDVGRDFDHILPVGALPSTLITLYLSYRYQQPLLPFALPSSLRFLRLRSSVDSDPIVFNPLVTSFMQPHVIPSKIEWLAVFDDGILYLIERNPLVLPAVIKELRICPRWGSSRKEDRVKKIRKLHPKIRIRWFQRLDFLSPPEELMEDDL